jgi:hypothetical protein
MTHEDRAALMKKTVAGEKAKLANMAPEKVHNTGFANAKKANPRLFAFQAKDVE